MTKSACLAAALLLSVSGAAQAQLGKNYDVKTMNFDLWCQEQAGLPAARCDKRTEEDEKTFEAYRATIERYEVPYLERKRQEEDLSRTLLHREPAQQGDANDAVRNPPPKVPPP